MSANLLRALAFIALTASIGCTSQAQDRSDGARDRSRAAAPNDTAARKAAPPKPLSADAEAPTGEKKDDRKDIEKDKRGNTPPGTDRSGGGPASGAIVDPAGVTK